MDANAKETNRASVKGGNVADMCSFGVEDAVSGLLGPEHDRFTNSWSN